MGELGLIFFPDNVSWDDFKSDSISLNDIASLRKRASELVDKVGFDDGPGS
jgi:iron(III) transport system substrate-binding protein